jgi:hypothetical protein
MKSENGIRTSKSGKSVTVTVTIWDDPLPTSTTRSRRIRLKLPGGRITTVTNDPESVRGHPHLFNHLDTILKEVRP